jgi:hypothetical protein
MTPGYYQRLRERVSHSRSLIACLRKFLIILTAMLKTLRCGLPIRLQDRDFCVRSDQESAKSVRRSRHSNIG